MELVRMPAKLAIAEKFCIKTCRYSVSVLIEPKKIADKEAPCNAICGRHW
jgi:hypothetical protein